MRNDNFRAASFAEAGQNKAKRRSTNKLPTGELYEELETGRDSNAPSTRRHMMSSENRDSKDFLVDKSVKVKRHQTKSAWTDDENLTSEGNVLTTEAGLIKSKFQKNSSSLGEPEKKLKVGDKTQLETESEPSCEEPKRRESGQKDDKTQEKNFWEALNH